MIIFGWAIPLKSVFISAALLISTRGRCYREGVMVRVKCSMIVCSVLQFLSFLCWYLQNVLYLFTLVSHVISRVCYWSYLGCRGFVQIPNPNFCNMSLTVCVWMKSCAIYYVLCRRFLIGQAALTFVRAFSCIMMLLCNRCINTHVIVVCLFWSFWSCADQWRMMRWRWSMTSTSRPAASRLLSLGSRTLGPNGPSTPSPGICRSSERVDGSWVISGSWAGQCTGPTNAKFIILCAKKNGRTFCWWSRPFPHYFFLVFLIMCVYEEGNFGYVSCTLSLSYRFCNS